MSLRNPKSAVNLILSVLLMLVVIQSWKVPRCAGQILAEEHDPTAFLVVDIQVHSEDGITLTWNDLGTNFVYRVEYRDALSEGNWAPGAPTDQWPIADTTWTDAGASGSGTRFYRIQTEALHDPPSPPGDVAASVEDGKVVIAWEAVPGASSYNVYWSTDAKFSPLDANREEDVTSPFSHTGLDYGVTYYYVVSAVGNMGESEVSSVVSVILAPPVDGAVATALFSATEFLYTGDSPVQTGVAGGVIVPKQAAVLRGKAMGRDGEPLSGVAVTILGHPEFGYTSTRNDGMFDMAVNGGGYLTVNYSKEGYLKAQRRVNVLWQDYAWLPDVVLIPRDTQVTTVNLGTGSTQVARGGQVSDVDGTRQATLFFPSGTAAELEFADGSSQSITALSVRATEFSVGENGPEAMPALLPPTVGYTYCVEFTVDEADAAGAINVRFATPLPAYVENFLNFPVGGIVPVGSYDSEKAAWIPSTNGRVIEILGVEGGLAQLDVDGSGQPADEAALADLSITDAEREQLAALYMAGQSLWRFSVNHFTPWDCNWPYGPPEDAEPPKTQNPAQDFLNELLCEKMGLCKLFGSSVIEAQNQTVGESVLITGTPYSIHYQSDRVPGRKSVRTLDIPLSSTEIPASVKRIELEIYVAGRRFLETFPAEPNQSYTFTWDGRDVYGRAPQGQQPVTVRIGHAYDAVYQEPAEFGQSFGQLSGTPITSSRARQEVVLWQEQRRTISNFWDARGQGLGGWTLSKQHSYDPRARVLHRGDGVRRSAGSINVIIDTFAGGGPAGNTGEGVPAKDAYIVPTIIAFGPDDTLYFSEYYFNRVRKLSPDGIITTVAGNMLHGYSGDGGPATQARLARPSPVAIGPDGCVYIGDKENYRIRRVDLDGIITTFAGNGMFGNGGTGDGGPASEASFKGFSGVLFGPDGSLYVSDYFDKRVRHIGPDGIITTVAGGGDSRDDGIPARQARLDGPGALALGLDGSLYIADESLIRRVSPNGIITTFAGDRLARELGDGGPATEARLKAGGIVAAPDGNFYITDQTNLRVRQIGGDGIIRTVAGTGVSGFSGDGGPAASATLNGPGGIALAPDGTLYFVDSGNERIRSLSPPLPGFTYADILVPSGDGMKLYLFDSTGLHRRTINSLTGAIIYELTYDHNGLLDSVEDGDANLTSIERDAEGKPTAIIAPFGQRTELSLNGDGYVEAITDPAGSTFRLTYVNEGLLKTLTNPRNHTTTFTYDDRGRLIRDDDPAGGFVELERTEDDNSYTVALRTAEDNVSSYKVELLPTGESRRVNTSACCTQSEVLFGTDGSTVVTYSDGMATAEVEGPDPRFGMQAPVTEGTVSVTPGGLTFQLTREREAALADPGDPLSVETLNETVEINGRTHSSAYDALTRTWAGTSPEGRQTTTMLDEQGRVLDVQLGNLESLRFVYDDHGRVERMTDGTRQSGFVYDATTGYLKSVTNPLEEETIYERDAHGWVTGLTLPENTAWGYKRDEMGNLLELTEPDGTTQHEFTYTPVNLLETYRSPLGGQETFTYNKDKKLTRRQYPSGNAVEWVHNMKGQLAESRTPEGNHTFGYDPDSGSLTQAISRDGQQVDYSYDGSLLKSATWSNLITGSIGYTYSNDFRVSQMEYAGITLGATYDNDGLLTGVGDISLTRDEDNGLLTGIADGDFQVVYSYNSYGELSSATVTHGSDRYDVSYTCDALGRISQRAEIIAGETHTWGYEYDSIGQLITVKRDGIEVESYTYDSVGNRIGINNTLTGRNLASDDYSYDADNKLLTAGENSYSYDADGQLNQVTEGTSVTTYNYNTDGTLTSVDLADGRQISYQCDVRGRRIARSVEGARTHAWLYGQGPLPLAEYDGTSSLRSTFIYVGPGVPVTMMREGSTYHIVSDHLGSPRLVVDDTGSVVKQVDYDAFGNVFNDTNPAFDICFGFAGGMADPDHRLIRFGARDYQPAAGRWTSKDPILFIGRASNLYVYTGNDPVNWLDRQGLQQSSKCLRGGVSFNVLHPYLIDHVKQYLEMTDEELATVYWQFKGHGVDNVYEQMLYALHDPLHLGLRQEALYAMGKSADEVFGTGEWIRIEQVYEMWNPAQMEVLLETSGWTSEQLQQIGRERYEPKNYHDTDLFFIRLE
ncbi:hypothetical protein HQ563_04390 [bacterium]|nr:hypothetical protein [bacterium]